MLLFCLSFCVAVVIVIVSGKAIENVIHEKRFVLSTTWIENCKLVINGSAIYYQINTKNGLNYSN